MSPEAITTGCPISVCTNTKRLDDLFCRSCWRKVPQPLRTEIWHLFETARGSQAHLAAIAEAFRVVEDARPSQMRLLPT